MFECLLGGMYVRIYVHMYTCVYEYEKLCICKNAYVYLFMFMDICTYVYR